MIPPQDTADDAPSHRYTTPCSVSTASSAAVDHDTCIGRGSIADAALRGMKNVAEPITTEHMPFPQGVTRGVVILAVHTRTRHVKKSDTYYHQTMIRSLSVPSLKEWNTVVRRIFAGVLIFKCVLFAANLAVAAWLTTDLLNRAAGAGRLADSAEDDAGRDYASMNIQKVIMETRVRSTTLDRFKSTATPADQLLSIVNMICVSLLWRLAVRQAQAFLEWDKKTNEGRVQASVRSALRA